MASQNQGSDLPSVSSDVVNPIRNYEESNGLTPRSALSAAMPQALRN
ncbi:MAG: hypothetical protein KME50_38255 [Nostoc desertorum CM1-VF14]|nr:hypothetical protein [Nostoc desertorum CM1-VF14]